MPLFFNYRFMASKATWPERLDLAKRPRFGLPAVFHRVIPSRRKAWKLTMFADVPSMNLAKCKW